MILPDLLGPGLAVVFCGTAAGAASARAGAYYANPGNQFWRAVHRAGLTPRLFAPQEWRALLPLGIGLTDLNKTEFGQDAQLSPDGWDLPGLIARIEAHRPGRIAFTSKTAASKALGAPTGRLAPGRQAQALGGAEVWVLPSPSGQARAYWDEGPWRALGQAVLGRGGAVRLEQGGGG
jgi:TDG/mug DNA glycosylase family protein